MRSLMAFILGSILLTGSAFAGCALDENGEHAATLTEAAAALEGTNPALAAKIKHIAETCCKPAAKPAASEHPSSGSEHPTEHPA